MEVAWGSVRSHTRVRQAEANTAKAVCVWQGPSPVPWMCCCALGGDKARGLPKLLCPQNALCHPGNAFLDHTFAMELKNRRNSEGQLSARDQWRHRAAHTAPGNLWPPCLPCIACLLGAGCWVLGCRETAVPGLSVGLGRAHTPTCPRFRTQCKMKTRAPCSKGTKSFQVRAER